MKIKPISYINVLVFFNGTPRWDINQPDWINPRYASLEGNTPSIGIHGNKDYEMAAVRSELLKVLEE